MENSFLYSRIHSLNDYQKVIFAFSIAERLMPLYYNFSNNKNQALFSLKDYKDLQNSLSKGFEYIEKKTNFSIQEVQDMIEHCVDLAPDTEVISTNESDLAQKTALSIAYGFDYILENDVKSITNCSDMPLQCLYIIYIVNKLELVEYNILINIEIEIQEKLLELIESTFSIESVRKFNQKNLIDLKVH